MTKNDLKTAKRLMKYVTEKYKFQFILVFFCILISAVATTAVSLSLRYLLDDFILPVTASITKMISTASIVRSGLSTSMEIKVTTIVNNAISACGIAWLIICLNVSVSLV